VELPEESLAHYHRRVSRNRVPIRLALPNVPERPLLSNLHERSFSNIGPSSQRGFRYLVRINRYVPLPWNETNPDYPSARYFGQEESIFTEDTKASTTALKLAAQGLRPTPIYSSQTQTDSRSSEPCSDNEASPERARGSCLKS